MTAILTAAPVAVPAHHETRPAIAARAVGATKAYGKGESAIRALDAIDVEFEAGRFTAIMGPSGSGKSTLMHALAGLDDLTDGQVFIGDVDLTSAQRPEAHQAAARSPRLRLPGVQPGADAHGPREHHAPDGPGRPQARPRVARPRRVAPWGSSERLEHRPSELSGGQQQRVAVARALAGRPEIVFADEPTGNLDSRTGAEILAFMRLAVRELGQTIVMVTHDPVAASYADRVVFLADGRIVDELQNPTAESVLDRMKSFGR